MGSIAKTALRDVKQYGFCPDSVEEMAALPLISAGSGFHGCCVKEFSQHSVSADLIYDTTLKTASKILGSYDCWLRKGV